jgi:hypothetical protein
MIHIGDKVRFTDDTAATFMSSVNDGDMPKWIIGIEGEVISYNNTTISVLFKKGDKKYQSSFQYSLFGIDEWQPHSGRHEWTLHTDYTTIQDVQSPFDIDFNNYIVTYSR